MQTNTFRLTALIRCRLLNTSITKLGHPVSKSPVPTSQASFKQSTWDQPGIQSVNFDVWSFVQDPHSNSHLLAASFTYSGNWLHSTSVCLQMEVGWRGSESGLGPSSWRLPWYTLSMPLWLADWCQCSPQPFLQVGLWLNGMPQEPPWLHLLYIWTV